MGELEATSYGFAGGLLASLRWLGKGSVLVELQAGLDVVRSYAGLEGGVGSWQTDYARSLNLWWGFLF